jgi:predicted NodU family carbamoyl transferase
MRTAMYLQSLRASERQRQKTADLILLRIEIQGWTITISDYRRRTEEGRRSLEERRRQWLARLNRAHRTFDSMRTADRETPLARQIRHWEDDERNKMDEEHERSLGSGQTLVEGGAVHRSNRNRRQLSNNLFTWSGPCGVLGCI